MQYMVPLNLPDIGNHRALEDYSRGNMLPASEAAIEIFVRNKRPPDSADCEFQINGCSLLTSSVGRSR
jgi:hypothetical protein